MKRLLGAILLVTFLNGCSGLPLVSTLEGSLSINGAIATATGKYEHQAASALVNLASHKSTGKTVGQNLYAMVENKYTKKRLKKHFKNKELTITDFKIADKSISDYIPNKKSFAFLTRYNVPPIHVTQTFVEKTKIKWEGFNYRVYDTNQPNFEVN
tara:strand:+ start:151 stop:618 length:468 start_codon:yes stop_codon:yes gene_type:complete